MSLARAFTKRMKRTDDATSPRAKGGSSRFGVGGIDVSKISSPITLLSTTNMHALNAPDIHKSSPESASSSSVSTHSGHDSDFSSIDRSFLNSHGDGSSSSPATPSTPPMGPAAGFFEKSTDAPKLPQRSPSHSKKAHVELSRKRSVQRMTPPPMSLARASSVRDSANLFASSIQEEHSLSTAANPFGAELAKVNEVAEDFGAKNVVLDEEEQLMLNKGLCKFGVNDYISEIAGLSGGVYEDQLGVVNPWL